MGETTEMINAVAATLDLPRDAPNRDATVKGVRSAGIAWVAKYRRQNEYAGRPSYGATYTAVNALAGHVNNFGTGTPIPAKRADRLKIELSDAARAAGAMSSRSERPQAAPLRGLNFFKL